MRYIKYSLVLGLGIVLLISGCGKKMDEKPEEKGQAVSREREEVLSKQDLDEDTRRMIESTKSPAKEVTSHDKIQVAFEAGEISKEEAVTKSIKASFSPEKVAEKFKGVPSSVGRTSLNDDLQWAINNWDSFDEQTQAELEPFVVSPDDPKYFEHNDTKTGFNWINSAKANNGYAGPIIFSTIHFEGAGKIYYWGVDKAKAERIKPAMEKAWPKYKDLLGMYPSNETKIYYTNTGGDYGIALWKEDYCEIRIGNNHPEKYIEPVTAHELFHCFQYYLSPTYIEHSPGSDWITEATAVWAEDFVYPEKNSEHIRLTEYYDNLHKDRLSIAGTEEYGSYMWFFFLSQYLGNDKHVNTVLQKGKNGQIRDAVMDSVSNFDNTYAEFALYNWNQVPWEIYQDVPKYPDKNPTGNATEDIYLYDKTNKDMPVALNKGSIKYIYHYFDTDIGNVNRVKFDFKTLTTDQAFQRQALIKIGDVWHREDWNEITEKEYCRKDETERVRAVILIYSNADLKSGKSAVYNIDTKGDCKVKKRGHISITERVAFKPKTIYNHFTLDEVVEYDLELGKYIVIERTAFCSTKDTASFEMFGTYGYDHMSSVIVSTGNLIEKYEIDGNNDIRFDISDDGKSGYILTGMNSTNKKWVKRSTTMTGSIGGVAEFLSSCGGGWASRYELKPEEILEDRIKGKRIISVPSGTIEFEFEYELP